MWDHPRTRGVYSPSRSPSLTLWGSSPHARGLRALIIQVAQITRIIPARAGFTSGCVLSCGGSRDHPRTRGVYGGCPAACLIAAGSSPHARGLRRPHGHERELLGIIPARAGFTRCPRPRPGPGPDHPRTRGVYPSGSVGAGQADWIIPARAGFTRRGTRVRRGRTDHPRTRGVYRNLFQTVAEFHGSSPHARGLRGRPAGQLREIRIIPARAGFTACPYAIPYARGDHPRTRGVYRGAG